MDSAYVAFIDDKDGVLVEQSGRNQPREAELTRTTGSGDRLGS